MNSRNELPPAHREALHRAHEAGLRISLCTGRSLVEARTVLDQIGLDLDAGVFVFGSIVTDLAAGRTLARTPLSEELTGRLVDHFQSRGYPLLVLFDPTETGFDYLFVHGERNLAAHEAWLKVTPATVERTDAWRPLPCHPVRLGVVDDPAHIAGTVAELRAAFPPDQLKFNPIYAPNYGLHVVECFAPEVNKWHGISQLCALWGMEGSQVVTLGDDVNDVEMIARAGLGVAMGNAVEAVRAAARLQVASNDADGVADLVDRLLSGRVPPPS